MTENDIKHMVGCFLAWRLPENFHPDGGISFEPLGNKGTKYEYRREPTGTNLFDYTQAEAMVRHMAAELDDMPLTAEEEAMIEDAWQKHKAAAPEMTENSDKPVALKPCPHCNSGEVRLTANIGKPCSADHAWVECSNCHACGPECSTEAEAIAEWNRRPTSAGQSEEVVERVARAICTAEGFEPDRRNARGVINWVSYKPATSAAISTLDLPAIQRDARRVALEEAARECERMDDVATYDDETDEGRMYGAGYQEATGKCAAAIRALKEGTGE